MANNRFTENGRTPVSAQRDNSQGVLSDAATKKVVDVLRVMLKDSKR